MEQTPGLAFLDTDVADLVMQHEVDVVAQRGLATVRVPLDFAAGRAGFGPRLALEYGSAAGNSPFGIGWSLSGLLGISLSTTRGLPRYDGEDDYSFSGAGDLVPWLRRQAGQWRPRVDDLGAFWVHYYRPRVETQHIRIERWVEKATRREHWRTRDVDNVLTVYGLGAARIADPGEPRHTFAWLAEAQYDPSGNAIVFDYEQEDLSGVALGRSSERRQVGREATQPQRYLKRIRYGNTKPMRADQPHPAGNRWMFEVVFDYGDHADPDAPSPTPEVAWPVRVDPYSTYRPGFEVRTYRLCRRILAFNRFPALGPAPVLVGSYKLEHGPDPVGTVLTAVGFTGSRREASGQISRRSIPPVRFRYSVPIAADAFVPAPAEAEVNVPGGLANGHRWVDLLGEGLPGILTETSEAWYFKANLGGGRFETQQIVPTRPGYRLGRSAISDFDGDGNTNVAVLHGREAGFYEYARDEDAWSGFRTMPALPHLEAAGRKAQWVDLSGDGRADLLVANDGRLTWYPADGKEGFAAPVEVQQDVAEPGSLAVREDLALDLFFADMNGDGLVDQVRVRNGRIEYWPHLGNGRFGDPILMDGSPTFAADSEFDAARVLLVDLDGNGAADVVYVGHGEVRYWFNAHGNELVEGGHLTGLPFVDNISSLQVLDFLGDGTPQLVWSTTLSDRAHTTHYLPLTGGIRPRLLIATDNSMGREVQIEYASSAKHYLRDKASGRLWRTRLPSHSIVVESKRVIDQIGGSQSVMRFAYHDGRFDSDERSVAGFGFVEVFDSEIHDATAATPEIVGTAPSCIRTWFNVGEPNQEAPPDRYRGDPVRSPLAPFTIEDGEMLLAEETEEAARALTGLMRRQEVYAVSLDGIVGEHPIEVVQAGYRIRRLQPSSEHHEVSFTYFQSERLTDVYEQVPDDPRASHQLTLEVDDVGLPTLTCYVAYPRRPGQPAETPAQQRLLLGATKRRLLNLDLGERYELGIPLEEQDVELSGIAPAGSVFAWDELRAEVLAATAAPAAFDSQPSGTVPVARLIGWEQVQYWNDARTAPRVFGQVGAVTLLHHEESACFTPQFVAEIYAGRVSATMLQSHAGYGLRDGYWWQSGPTYQFSGDESFHRFVAIARPDGGTTAISYDADNLAIVQVDDPLGNRTRASIDYNLVAPERLTDANDVVSEIVYDPLGIAIVSTTRGRRLDSSGAAQLHGQDLLDVYTPRSDPKFDDVITDPSFYVQTAAQYLSYELDTWTHLGTPPWSVGLMREELRHDGGGGGVVDSPVQIAVSYFDGVRRVIQAKARVEGGMAIQRDATGAVVLDSAGVPLEAPANERWLVTGHTVFNLKQQAVREYEAFFTSIAAYEPEEALARFGSVRELRWDATGRSVREDLANGTFARTLFGPWRTTWADPNDTVLESIYRVLRDSLADGHPEKDALRKAELHADTAVSSDLDPLGREVRRVERSLPADRISEMVLDLDGRPLRISDPRGITAFEYVYDMLGRPSRTTSADAGASWSLLDNYDRPSHAWNALGTHVHRSFDQLDRPTSTFVDGALGLSHITERMTYGEDPSVAQAKARNLRGRLAIHFDQAGIRRLLQYDADGNLLRRERQFLSQVEGEPDWTTAGSVALDPTRYVTEDELDGLGRLRRQGLPDGTERRYEFLAGGSLGRVIVSSTDGKVTARRVLDGAVVNARGQRTTATLGNGVEVHHEFDRETFRTSRISAQRPGLQAGAPPELLQDLRYTYDPVGNVTRCADLTQQPGVAGPFLQGINVAPEMDFTYDPTYQLTRAAGRIHQSLLEHDYRPGLIGPGALKGTRHITFNNGAAVERYVQTYQYDASGNLERLVHTGTSHSWITDFWVSPTSNRSMPTTDPLGNAVASPESHFDALGNTRYLHHTRRLDWNYRNSLAQAVIIDRSAAGQPNDAEYYQYDGGGLRARKVSDRLTPAGIERTEILYFDGCEIRRIRSAGNLVLERLTSHVTDGSQRIALIDRWNRDDHARETDDVSQPRIRYELTNHLGSSQLALNESGAVVSYEEYLPFGGTAFIAGDDLREVARRDYRFCGKECDGGTGLYYFEYRYYAPWIGRWMSPDPTGPEDDLNLYRYVQNNPINLIDPDGLQSSLPSGSVTFVPNQLTGGFRDAYLRLSPAQRAQWERGTLGFLVDANGDIRPASRREILTEARRRAREGEHVTLGLTPTGARPRPRPRPRPPAEETESGSVLNFEPEVITAGPTEAILGLEDEPGSSPAALGDAGGPPKADSGGGGGAEHGSDGRDGGTRSSTGGRAGDGDRSSSRDGSATGVHAADGSSTPSTPPAGGLGGGSGAGLGRSGNGPGAGGTTPGRAPGVGEGGRRGSGAGSGHGAGRGSGRGGRTGTGARPGTGGGGGRASGSSASGGAGNAAQDADDGTGGGGVPGGTGTGSGTTPPSDPGADPGGDGTIPGANTGNLPASPGGGPPPVPGQTVNGDDPNGSRSGKPGGVGPANGQSQGGQGGLRPGGSSTGSPQGTGQGEGPPPQPGGETGGSHREGPPVERTTGDKIVEVLGYLNLEFGDADPKGQSGGVPGGSGTHNWGAWGQALYGLLTIASVVSMFFGGAGIKAGLATLKGGLKAAVGLVARAFTRQFWRREVGGLLRSAGTRFVRFFWDPRAWREVSAEYWSRRGGANGRSLHHWLFPQGGWGRRIPQGLRNAGFNLVRLPNSRWITRGYFGGDINRYMGMAARWGRNPNRLRAVYLEWGIRVGLIPGLTVGSFAGGYKAGEALLESESGGSDVTR